jgi:hypothetical protein
MELCIWNLRIETRIKDKADVGERYRKKAEVGM